MVQTAEDGAMIAGKENLPPSSKRKHESENEDDMKKMKTSSSSSTSASLTVLPAEVLLKIFSYLISYKDFANLEGVNRLFRRISWQGMTSLEVEFKSGNHHRRLTGHFNKDQVRANPDTVLDVFCGIWKKATQLTKLDLSLTKVPGKTSPDKQVILTEFSTDLILEILHLSHEYPRKISSLALDKFFSVFASAPPLIREFSQSLTELNFNWDESLVSDFFVAQPLNININCLPLFEAARSCVNLKCLVPRMNLPTSEMPGLYARILAPMMSLERLDVDVKCRTGLAGFSYDANLLRKVAAFLAKLQLENVQKRSGAYFHLDLNFKKSYRWSLAAFTSALSGELKSSGFDGLKILKKLYLCGLEYEKNRDLRPLYKLVPCLEEVTVEILNKFVDPILMISDFLNFFASFERPTKMGLYWDDELEVDWVGIFEQIGTKSGLSAEMTEFRVGFIVSELSEKSSVTFGKGHAKVNICLLR